MVVLGVVDGRSVGRELSFEVDRSGSRLAVHHTGALEDVFGVPLLGQEEAIGGALNVHAEEEAQLAEVLDRELCLRMLDELV